MFLEKVLKYNERNRLFNKGDRIVVGVSGGKDSMCLLDVLCRLRREMNLTLLVIHVNHGIRGAEADRDEQMVRDHARKCGLEFICEQIDIREIARQLKMSEEEAGRIKRYELMTQLCMERGYQKIAVAHHQDDVAETVLFQLFRGSGPRGLSGINPKNQYVIRPILFASRVEIDEYVSRHHLPFCEDSSNFQEEYTRNKIRLRVFPYVETEINSKARSHVAKAAEKINMQNQYIAKVAKREYMRVVHVDRGQYYYDCEEFDKLDIVIRLEILRLIIGNMRNSLKDITEAHYKTLLSMTKWEVGKHFSMTDNIRVERRYGCVWYRDESETKPDYDRVCEFPFDQTLEVRKERLRICMDVISRDELPEEIPQKDYTKWFDYDKIQSEMRLRNPLVGDYFVLDSSGRRKKLSRHYIDEKIPSSERSDEIVLADGHHVLWAVPGRISAAYKVNKDTKRVLVVVASRG